MNRAPKRKKSDDEILDLGKKLVALYETGYIDKKQAIWFSFLKGLAGGVGAFIGGTIVIGLLAAILSQFSELPFINSIVDAAKQTLNQ